MCVIYTICPSSFERLDTVNTRMHNLNLTLLDPVLAKLKCFRYSLHILLIHIIVIIIFCKYKAIIKLLQGFCCAYFDYAFIRIYSEAKRLTASIRAS